MEIWEPEGLATTIEVPESPVDFVTLSREGSLVCACAGQAAFVWDTATDEVVQQWVQDRYSLPLFTSDTELAWFTADGLHVWTQPGEKSAEP